jgi:hypothetical protein
MGSMRVVVENNMERGNVMRVVEMIVVIINVIMGLGTLIVVEVPKNVVVECVLIYN